MDTPSHFFSDSLAYEDSNPFQEDDHDVPYEVPHEIPHDISHDISQDVPPDVGMSEAGLQSYHVFDHRLSIDQSPISGDGPTLGERPGLWDGFAEPSAMETNNSLFVDPGLYGGRDQHVNGLEGVRDSIDANTSCLSDVMSQGSTRRSSSNKTHSHRSSKSGSTSTDITPPDQDPPKKRKQRSKKDPNMEEDDHKRNKFLERNRLAASKCREKKKLYTQELEGTKINLEARNVSLQREYGILLSEVSDLKHQLMVHAKCNDRNIDLWLENEARRFVQTSDAFGQTFANLGQSGQAAGVPGVPGSPKSRHASIAPNYPAMPGVQLGVLRPGAEGQGGGGGGGGGGLTYGQSPGILAPPTNTTPPTHQQPGSGSGLYTPPCGANGGYSNINPPGMKKEPDINYDHMPDDMFSDQSTFGSG
ncbi:uncharacterized protein B0T23DRAFT_425369 [Neurospora hispaniola]|uniref:BZIP domain-containing protein n=1 Tax=Neurospora hispaniola TaxID=588809 RepID=A0AAJ0IGR7_9PEZI|nr:hypothetical protein B0T23DRAFT_425369 [Neurospora hispaniola]